MACRRHKCLIGAVSHFIPIDPVDIEHDPAFWLLIEAPAVIPSQKLTRWDEDHVLFNGFNRCWGITSRFRLAACLFNLDLWGCEKSEHDSTKRRASEERRN